MPAIADWCSEAEENKWLLCYTEQAQVHRYAFSYCRWSLVGAQPPLEKEPVSLSGMAAGTVFAGLVVDVLWRLLQTSLLRWAALGMGFSLALMMFIRIGEEKSRAARHWRRSSLPMF